MKFAICNEIFQGQRLEDIFPQIKRFGYDALEIAPFTIADSVTEISQETRQRIRNLASENGVEISGIHWVLVKPEWCYINHIDKEIRKKTAQYFVELVKFCSDIGGKYIIVGSPKQRMVMPGVDMGQAKVWAIETLFPAIRLAEILGITICLEPLGKNETNFINTAQEAIQLVKQAGSKAFKIILDVKAMFAEGVEDVTPIIRESQGYFAYFHANDRNLKGPGMGNVDFKPIISTLKKVGYNGYVSVEVFNFEDGAEVIAKKSIMTLKETATL